MIPRLSLLLYAFSALSTAAVAGPIEQRQAAAPSTTTSTPTAALIQTTVNGKATTVSVAVPSDSSTTPTGSSSTSSSSVSSTTTEIWTSSTTGTSAPISTTLPLCKEQTTSPFCQPGNNTIVYPGDTYWVTWNPDFFPINSTITVALDYANNSRITAWISAGMPREKGFVTVTMSKDWLQGHKSTNLTFIAIAYTANSGHTTSPYDGPTVMLEQQSLPVPQRTKLPDKTTLAIGLPVALGGCALITVGLYLVNRSVRTIGLGNVMGRRKGYGVGKSRRQRLGLQKGAIQLQERELAPGPPLYRDDDAISRAPRRDPFASATRGQTGHVREESLGSLVDEEDSNAFRREMKAQRQQR